MKIYLQVKIIYQMLLIKDQENLEKFLDENMEKNNLKIKSVFY